MYLNDPVFNVVDSVGAPISGAKAYFYQTGTTTLVNTYTTVQRTVANTNPVIADSAGRFPPIYLDPDVTYRMKLTDAADILILDRDPIAGAGDLTAYQYLHRTIATAGQTVFTLPIVYTVNTNAVSVFVNGLKVEQGVSLDFVETNSTTITFNSGLASGDLVVFVINVNAELVPIGAFPAASVSPFGASLIDDADAAAARLTLGVGTTDSPQFAAINLGAASDTTLTRASAGVMAVEGATVATLSAAQTFTAQQTLTSGLVIQSATAAAIAAIGNAINTTDKVAGKVVYDTTNNRIMIASGSTAASNWYIADGSASVTPS